MGTQAEWWEEFFSGIWLDVQRQIKTHEETRSEVDFIERVLQLPPGAQVLDVPCGTGRHSLELATRGYRVTGVDITSQLLDDARRGADELQVEVEWECRDMRDLPWEGEFDGAFCWWGSFGYFDESGDRSFLEACSRVLKPGARFLVDSLVAEALFPVFAERMWRRSGDTLVLYENCYDHVHGRVDTTWTLVQEGKKEMKYSSMRIYTYRELCQLLGDAGFVHYEGYGSISSVPFVLGSRRLYVVAVKG
jgi:SAM-dependent methyltransferase